MKADSGKHIWVLGFITHARLNLNMAVSNRRHLENRIL